MFPHTPPQLKTNPVMFLLRWFEGPAWADYRSRAGDRKATTNCGEELRGRRSAFDLLQNDLTSMEQLPLEQWYECTHKCWMLRSPINAESADYQCRVACSDPRSTLSTPMTVWPDTAPKPSLSSLTRSPLLNKYQAATSQSRRGNQLLDWMMPQRWSCSQC